MVEVLDPSGLGPVQMHYGPMVQSNGCVMMCSCKAMCWAFTPVGSAWFSNQRCGTGQVGWTWQRCLDARFFNLGWAGISLQRSSKIFKVRFGVLKDSLLEHDMSGDDAFMIIYVIKCKTWLWKHGSCCSCSCSCCCCCCCCCWCCCCGSQQ